MIYHEITHDSAVTVAESESDIRITTDTSYFTCDLWRVRILWKIDRVITAPHCILILQQRHAFNCQSIKPVVDKADKQCRQITIQMMKSCYTSFHPKRNVPDVSWIVTWSVNLPSQIDEIYGRTKWENELAYFSFEISFVNKCSSVLLFLLY